MPIGSVWSESTTLNFSGNIRVKPCVIRSKNQLSVVKLGRWQRLTDFPKIGSTSTPINHSFYITCESGSALRTITYEATPTNSGGEEYIKITNEGAEEVATGVAVKVVTLTNNNTIKLNTPMENQVGIVSLGGDWGTNMYNLNIQVQYIRTGDITPGQANATLGFTLTHE